MELISERRCTINIAENGFHYWDSDVRAQGASLSTGRSGRGPQVSVGDIIFPGTIGAHE